jgi:transcriptional regulatory protein AMDR
MGDFDASITEKQAQAVMHHTKLCTIISDLVRSHFSVRVIKSGIISRRAAVEAVDNALAQWLVELPPYLRDRSAKMASSTTMMRAGEDGDRCYQSSVMLLHLTYNAVLIQFHRFLSNERGGDGLEGGSSSRTTEQERMQTAGDKEICAEAASNIIQIFERLGAATSGGFRCCCFWAPHALFTAMLEVGGQLKSVNPILAVRSKEKYESGLRSLRKLTRYWLFATSVLRLFESNSIKPPRRETAASSSHRRRETSASSEQASPDQESPLATISSAGAVSNSGGSFMAMNHQEPGNQQQQQNQHQQQQTTMDWVQMFSYGDPNIGNMHVERNRWQNSLEEWQSLYWSDPLDNIRLEDNFGQFQYEWQGQ